MTLLSQRRARFEMKSQHGSTTMSKRWPAITSCKGRGQIGFEIHHCQCSEPADGVYIPPTPANGERRPAVVFIHGGAGAFLKPKVWGIYKSWGDWPVAHFPRFADSVRGNDQRMLLISPGGIVLFCNPLFCHSDSTRRILLCLMFAELL